MLPTMDLVQEGFVVKEDDVIKSQSVDILKRRDQISKEYVLSDELYKYASGQNTSSMKLSFEAYIQQYYFKSIISSANKRLTILTNGGVEIQPYIVEKIVNSETGEVTYKHEVTELGKKASEENVNKI